MVQKQNQSPKVVLGDIEYDVNKDFNDEQKKLYLHLKNINDKIDSNNFIQEQLSVNKQAFMQMLTESLTKPKDHSPHDPGDENDSW